MMKHELLGWGIMLALLICSGLEIYRYRNKNKHVPKHIRRAIRYR